MKYIISIVMVLCITSIASAVTLEDLDTRVTALEALHGITPVVDTDGDGIPDSSDPCPLDPTNTCNDPPVTGLDLTALTSATAGMVSGEWRELSNTQIPLTTLTELSQIWADNGGQEIKGLGGPSSVIKAWSSAAYDATRGHWYFMGGGHADYGGNEVFRFDLTTLTWSRLTTPAPLTGANEAEDPVNDVCQVPVGSPSSSHTYDGLVWNSAADQLWLFPHKGFCKSGRVHIQQRWWAFDPATLGWTEHSTPGMAGGYAGTAYLPNTNQVFLRNAETFDPDGYTKGPVLINADGSVAQRGTTTSPGAASSVAYNPLDGSVLGLFYSGLYRQDLTTLGSMALESSYPSEILALPASGKPNGAGFEFHPPSGKFVLWFGGRETAIYDPATNTFTAVGNTQSVTAPTRVNSYIYGHWQYISELDVFVGYANSGQGVWVYKP